MWYGFKFNSDRKYFYNVIYERYSKKRSKEYWEKRNAELNSSLYTRR